MIGFFFKNQHSRDFWMSMESAARPLLPQLRRGEYEIAGRHGTVQFGSETYAKRYIDIDIAFARRDARDLQTLARQLAHWLSGEGLLWFDDEPDKAYDAKIYDAVDTEQLLRVGRASITFECQPFARSIHFLQNVQANAQSGSVAQIYSHGTVDTPAIIILTNTGDLAMGDVWVSRRALNR